MGLKQMILWLGCGMSRLKSHMTEIATWMQISQNLDDLSPEDATGLIEGFPPTSDNYSSEDIVDVGLCTGLKRMLTVLTQ